MADLRLPMLAGIPAVVRFVSIEPILEPVSLANHLDLIDWVICGGESGSGYRTMEIAWAEDILRQCREAKIPFFMKQVSGTTTRQTKLIPTHLQVREFPDNV
jgi:protein gp37